MFFDFGSGILLCMCKGVKGDWSSGSCLAGVPGGIEGRAGKGKADALFSGKTWRICGKSHDGQTFEAFGAMPGRGRDYR